MKNSFFLFTIYNKKIMRKPQTPEQKEAKRLYDIEYRKNNIDKIKQRELDKYNSMTPEERKELAKKRYVKRDKEKKKKDDKKYAIKHKDKLNAKKRKWAKDNPEKNRASKTKYFINKLNSDPLFKVRHNIGNAIRQAFKRKGFTKNNKCFTILGCTYEEFITHLESKFESWMTWNNYGNPKDGIYELNKTWDIDHIIPLSTAKTEDDIMRLNHYTNLQPLCSFINQFIKKNNL